MLMWMRKVACVFFLTGCSSPEIVVVHLSQTSFGTTGGNLFNCSTPAFPSDENGVVAEDIVCNPTRSADGTLSTTPVTVNQQMGCGDGHGALVTVTCAGTGSGDDVAVLVTLSITNSCGNTNASTEPGDDPQTFAFADIAPGANAASPGALESCSVFGNLCGTSNACAFNDWSAAISVTNMSSP